ncbi:MAG: PfkB family carbohydrate kinase [Chloroflexota bacterium]|nr:PfkB family carbohydrate kinase [Chloroflexota bacterium]
MLVVGSLALDNVVTPFGQVDEVLGGAASYFSLAASTFTDVRMVGVIGSDFPRQHLDLLASRPIDLSGLRRIDGGKTFRWVGRYDYDLNVAHTLDTQLNVFADFDPQLPERYQDTEFVYLANIVPKLQLRVLEQVRRPKFVGLDSMNFWIGNPDTRRDLARVIERVDAVFMNDAEIRQYTGTYHLLQAARQIIDVGPRVVLIKKGEHGALAVSREGVFVVAAYPLENVKDPTGAGDSFAGGFMGHLGETGDTSWTGIRRAMAYGSVVASFAVEEFSVERLVNLTREEVRERLHLLREATSFEADLLTAEAG